MLSIVNITCLFYWRIHAVKKKQNKTSIVIGEHICNGDDRSRECQNYWIEENRIEDETKNREIETPSGKI